jgi:hypothetical protein
VVLQKLQEFVEGIVNKILAQVMPVFEQKLEELKNEAIALLQKEIPILLDKVMAMLPMLAATVAKSVTDEIMKVVSNVLKIDPDIPGLSNVFDLSETVRNAINDSTPEEIHIPILSDVLDMFNPHKPPPA